MWGPVLLECSKLLIILTIILIQGSRGAQFGMVGEVESIDPGIVALLHTQNFIPVIAPVGVGRNNES